MLVPPPLGIAGVGRGPGIPRRRIPLLLRPAANDGVVLPHIGGKTKWYGATDHRWGVRG